MKNYVIFAVPKNGESDSFRSHDYSGKYTRKEAWRVADEANTKVSHTNWYVAQSEDAPPPLMGTKPEVKLTRDAALIQLDNLKRTSERQSAMLAQALKEKNDLSNKVTATDAEYYTSQIKRLQLDLSAAQTQLRAVRTLAKDFFEALGVK